jgi:hypothetical protein
MALSRQFRALVRVGTFFAAAWGVIGTILSMLTGAPFLPSLVTYGAMFGVVGGLSGISTALLLARGERGGDVGQLPTWRVASWGFFGGVIPGGVFSLLAVALGAADVLVPLLAVSVFSGGVGSVLSGSAAVAAKRVGSGAPEEQSKLPAT